MKDLEYFAEILLTRGVDALLKAVRAQTDWKKEELNSLMILLAYVGGTKWPTALVELGADVDAKGDEGDTAISACIHGVEDFNANAGLAPHFETAAEFLTLGCSPNAVYLDSYSISNLAFRRAQKDIFTLLLLAGADPDIKEPGECVENATLRNIVENSEQDWAKEVLFLRDRLFKNTPVI